MTEIEPATVSMRHPISVPCAISADDGLGTIQICHLVIMIDTMPVHALETPSLDTEAIDRWVHSYLAGKDLTRTMQLAPTSHNLAQYLARVFRAMDPHVGAVSVSLSGDALGDVYKVEFA